MSSMEMKPLIQGYEPAFNDVASGRAFDALVKMDASKNHRLYIAGDGMISFATSKFAVFFIRLFSQFPFVKSANFNLVDICNEIVRLSPRVNLDPLEGNVPYTGTELRKIGRTLNSLRKKAELQTPSTEKEARVTALTGLIDEVRQMGYKCVDFHRPLDAKVGSFEDYLDAEYFNADGTVKSDVLDKRVDVLNDLITRWGQIEARFPEPKGMSSLPLWDKYLFAKRVFDIISAGNNCFAKDVLTKELRGDLIKKLRCILTPAVPSEENFEENVAKYNALRVLVCKADFVFETDKYQEEINREYALGLAQLECFNKELCDELQKYVFKEDLNAQFFELSSEERFKIFEQVAKKFVAVSNIFWELREIAPSRQIKIDNLYYSCNALFLMTNSVLTFLDSSENIKGFKMCNDVMRQVLRLEALIPLQEMPKDSCLQDNISELVAILDRFTKIIDISANESMSMASSS